MSEPVTVEIRNLGPIARAEVRLRPFTVFVGPNNSGKSILAAAVHAAVGAAPTAGVVFLGGRTFYRQPYPIDVLRDIDPTEVEQLSYALRRDRHEPVEIGPTVNVALERMVEGSMAFYFENLIDNLGRAIGGKADDLVRIRGGRRMPARMVVETPDPGWRIEVSFSRPQPTFEIERQMTTQELLNEAL